MLENVILGTAQIGFPYGINNYSGVPEDLEIIKIFTVAGEQGIKFLDTASAYRYSEQKIGQFSGSQFSIVSKFPNVSSEVQLRECFSNSLKSLKTGKLYGYLAHNADNIIESPLIWQYLSDLKKRALIEKIGYSIYSTEQLDKLLELGLVPDLVQLPYSLLDRKFEAHLSTLKTLGTEIHIRSVFLQGLYFKDPETVTGKLLPLKSSLEKLQLICKENDTTISALALNFVLSNPLIDKIVIGVERASQLLENITAIKQWQSNLESRNQVYNIKVEQESLLNPANW